VKPLAGDPLTFHTIGVGRPRDVVLKPFYRIHHERYTIYWDVFDEPGWAKAQVEYQRVRERQRAIDEATIDVMRLGEMLGEQEHAFDGEKTKQGIAFGRKYREAAKDGWFSFDVVVSTSGPSSLLCTYWGSETGKRTFDIMVNGKKIASQSLDNNNPAQFFDVMYPIPPETVRNKTTATIRFQSTGTSIAGRVFGCKSLTGPITDY
jgi:hypothetical protein